MVEGRAVRVALEPTPPLFVCPDCRSKGDGVAVDVLVELDGEEPARRDGAAGELRAEHGF